MSCVSVIIPVYNTSKYLSECLDSVINQSFEDLEIICVNDGSTDGSLEILNDYRSRDSRIRVMTQENQGLSSARNTGLANSTGEYVLFLDSDDCLSHDAIEKAYDLAEDNSSDLVLFKIINFDDDTGEKSHYSYFELKVLKKMVGQRVFDYDDVKERFFRIPVTAPGKLFKRDLLEGTGFIEGLIFEDNPFFIEIMFKVKRAIVLDEYLYNRRIREDSITNSGFSKFKDCVEIYNVIEDVIKRYGKYEDLKGQLFHRRCRDIFLRFSQVPDEFKEEFFTIIKDDFGSKKEQYENDGTFDVASQRSIEIYNKAIECDTYRQFELSVDVFDLKKEISKTKKNNKKIRDQIENSKGKSTLKRLFRF